MRHPESLRQMVRDGSFRKAYFCCCCKRNTLRYLSLPFAFNVINSTKTFSMKKMSEIRRALELIKRVDKIENAPARRLALELGASACDRGSLAVASAHRAETSKSVPSPESPGMQQSVQEGAVDGGYDGRGGGRGGETPCSRGAKELGVWVGETSSRLFDAPWRGAGEYFSRYHTFLN